MDRRSMTERDYRTASGIEVHRLQPAIGAVLAGIDCAEPITPVLAEELRAALTAHGVIFLTGQQHIGFEHHLALAEVVGTPVNDGPDPARPMITPIAAKAGRREGTAAYWHADGCYLPVPPAVSILRAIDPCTFGGDTCFSSAVAAYDGLPEDMRKRIDGLRFRSCLAERMPKNNDTFGSAAKWEELRAKYPPVLQPCVSVHPDSGARALYVNRVWSLSIEGIDEAEGEALIDRLCLEHGRPEYMARWQWQPGAIAIWDNRLVMHYGVPDQTTDRYLERITVQGGPMLSIEDWESQGRKAA